MSFSTDIKNEIARAPHGKTCCASAELCGLIKSCGAIIMEGSGKLGVRIVTENPAVARRVKTLLHDRFGVDAMLMVGDRGFKGGKRVYEIVISSAKGGNRILSETGIVVKEGNRQIMEPGISKRFYKKKCCRMALARGLFLGAGTMSDPNNSYQLEMVFSEEKAAQSAKRLLSTFTDLDGKTRVRRERYVVYIKDAEKIKDFLGVIGAHRQLLKFEDVRIIKELRGRTNRQTNCEFANIGRSVSAAERQLAAIRKITETIGLEVLPKELRDTAATRLKNPEATLSEIGSLLEPNIGKSAVSARMKQIERMST
jgi:DNA-binding protein WhiA